jgi:hypothetical protein
VVVLQQQRPVEIDKVTQLRDHEGRRHGQRGAHHVAHHQLAAERLRRAGELQRLGQPAGLVQLDVDHAVAPCGDREFAAVQAGFVGRQRDRRVETLQRLVGSARQRLLDHARSSAARFRMTSCSRSKSSRVGVDHQRGVGRTARIAASRSGRSAFSFIFSTGASAAAAAGGHRPAYSSDGEHGSDRLRLDARQLPDGFAGLALEILGAVDRVARAGGQVRNPAEMPFRMSPATACTCSNNARPRRGVEHALRFAADIPSSASCTTMPRAVIHSKFEMRNGAGRLPFLDVRSFSWIRPRLAPGWV